MKNIEDYNWFVKERMVYATNYNDCEEIGFKFTACVNSSNNKVGFSEEELKTVAKMIQSVPRMIAALKLLANEDNYLDPTFDPASFASEILNSISK